MTITIKYNVECAGLKKGYVNTVAINLLNKTRILIIHCLLQYLTSSF